MSQNADFSDMGRFLATYFEECEERLADLEERLIALCIPDADLASKETWNALFRNVHSIKGGAGAFRLDAVVAFAHDFETLLDHLRSGAISADPAILRRLVEARDALAALVDAERDGRSLPEDFGAALRAQLCADVGARAADEDAPPAPARRRRVRIDFKPHPTMIQNGHEPLHIFNELQTLGALTASADVSSVPPLETLRPLETYISWTLELVTTESDARIRQAFEFVEDDCDLKLVEALDDEWEKDKLSGAPSAGMSPASTASNAAPPSQETIRVALSKIDRLVNMVGEIVITQSMLGERVARALDDADGGVAAGVETLAHHTRELQEAVMAIRAQPVKPIFMRMARLVQDTAPRLGKRAFLMASGETTEVDRTVVERLADPLTHMVRNALDHGIETPEARRARGKSEVGVIKVSASQRAGRFIITVEDDGAGLNREKLRAKAVEQGLIPPDAAMGDQELDQLIFAPGFSTADVVSDLSGRGVGMDVVRRNIQELGGRISVRSTPGSGAQFILSLPLTLAVLDGMTVAVGDEIYILPVNAIIESLRPKREDVHQLMASSGMFRVRGDYVPLLHLADLFGVQAAEPDPSKALVVLVDVDGERRIGLVIDEMLGQQQVVIKSLESNYRSVPGVTGATILGDGRVALILDVAAIAALWEQGGVAGDHGEGAAAPHPDRATKEIAPCLS